jgi:hypothetical protein
MLMVIKNINKKILLGMFILMYTLIYSNASLSYYLSRYSQKFNN